MKKTLLLMILYISSLLADVNVATYNIKWLGYSKTRDNMAIAQMLSNGNRDIVVIQEIVAPPFEITIGEKTIKADLDANFST